MVDGRDVVSMMPAENACGISVACTVVGTAESVRHGLAAFADLARTSERALAPVTID